MNDDVKKAVYVNLLLLAMADGKIAPAERAYLQRFASSAGITDAEAGRWQQELRDGNIGFLPVNDPAALEDALTIMARMVRVDEVFDAAEQEAYITLGKALGVGQDALGAALRQVWNTDPEAAFNAVRPAPAPGDDSVSVLVIEDDFRDRKALERASAGVRLVFSSLSNCRSTDAQPKIVLFHAADDRMRSKDILATLEKVFSDSKVAFVARRDQAAQIGWLLDIGAARCFVEPLYPDEIRRAVVDMISA